jgi:predicted acetyltransferase
VLSQKSLIVRPAGEDEQPIIEGMMERYLPDLGGSGPYPHLARYWQEPGRLPYLLCIGEEPVGFALIERLDPRTNELVELYVQASSRGRGVGRRAASILFGAHVGTWRVGVRKDNASGQHFWKAVLAGYPSVNVTEIAAPPAFIYEFIAGTK